MSDSAGEGQVLFRDEKRSRRRRVFFWLLEGFAVADVAIILLITALSKSPTPAQVHSAHVAIWGVLSLCTVLALSVTLLAGIVSLAVEVRTDGLYLPYFPLHRSFKKIPLDGAVKCSAVTYSPLAQYGGWGIRYTWKGKAYIAAGNRGARIEYGNGRHLLINSDRPEELSAAIEALLAKAKG